MRSKYSSTIYAFDIETTTENGIVSHYLSSFISVDFGMKNKPIHEIIESMSSTHFCRAAEDINTFLIALNERANRTGQRIIIFCHNFAYEFSFLIQNVNFVKNNFKNSKSLFIKRRIPLFINLDYLEFRCSYRLLNKSLEKLGENLGFEKLSIDYGNKYFSFSELPSVEYEYNERDVQLTLLSILKECELYSWCKTVDDIPLTSTGFTRKNNKAINTAQSFREWTSACNYQRRFDRWFIDFIERIFSGGYNHANAFYTARPLQNVGSMDIVSSYIDAILHRKYPQFFKEYKGDYKLDFLKKLIRINSCSYMDALQNFQQPFKRAFLARVTLQNVMVKRLKNNNLILPISVSKCDFFRNCHQDNGRVYSAGILVININEVDYFIISQFYDFELIECTALYFTRCYKDLPEFVTKSTREYLYEKSTLKEIIKKNENGQELTPEDFYNDKKEGYIYSSEQIAAIIDSSDRDSILNDNYRAAKNKLNAQYGINVQKLLTPDISYDIENDEFSIHEAQSIHNKYFARDFLKGTYITSYSRLNLFCYGLYLIDHTETALVYSDTDSWKVYGDLDNVKRINKEYNQLIELIVHNSEDYNVGYFDYEAEYKYFSTLGCKKYIYSDGERVVTTIAGVNKKLASEAYTELFKNINYDFELLCKVAFQPCTILDFNIINKLLTKYHNNEFQTIVTDENGDEGIISGVNMVELCQSDFILMDNLKPSVRQYIDHINNLQGQDLNILPTKIYRDSSGNVTYKYIKDWRSEVKLLSGDPVEFDKQVKGG